MSRVRYAPQFKVFDPAGVPKKNRFWIPEYEGYQSSVRRVANKARAENALREEGLFFKLMTEHICGICIEAKENCEHDSWIGIYVCNACKDSEALGDMYYEYCTHRASKNPRPFRA